MQSYFFQGRILCWFSCGVSSLIAAKVALEEYASSHEVEICYCDTLAYEHPDNYRFMNDAAEWLGREVRILSSTAFRDIYDVFAKERYLKGPAGAPCTRALKRNVRLDYSERWDRHVFGYTADETDRIAQFEAENPEIAVIWPLRDRGITKADCFRMVAEQGIEIPYMYKKGYKNNNCIGCVKGGAGYWNKVRRDFPYVFAMMSKQGRVSWMNCRSILGDMRLNLISVVVPFAASDRLLRSPPDAPRQEAARQEVHGPPDHARP